LNERAHERPCGAGHQKEGSRKRSRSLRRLRSLGTSGISGGEEEAVTVFSNQFSVFRKSKLVFLLETGN
jgi:hypothetical protein